jgi:hypothetical protein
MRSIRRPDHGQKNRRLRPSNHRALLAWDGAIFVTCIAIYGELHLGGLASAPVPAA